MPAGAQVPAGARMPAGAQVLAGAADDDSATASGDEGSCKGVDRQQPSKQSFERRGDVV